jgi:hypothetical protein
MQEGGHVAEQKDYSTRSEDEVKDVMRTIIRTSDSEDDIRRRIVEELTYPHSPDSIRIHFHQPAMALVMLYGPNGQVLTV